ncbi:uncharacterized protein B4U79_07536, partial [Dinothrombium tinctorium]
QLPRKFVVGFVSANSFNGDLNSNPFKFNHFNITNLVVYVDGIMIPSTAYTPDFDNNIYAREYFSLYEEMNQDHTHPFLNISFYEFKQSLCLFAFNLSPDRSDGPDCGSLTLIKRGAARIEVKFKNAPSTAFVMLTYAHYDNLIQIDRDRNVLTDY